MLPRALLFSSDEQTTGLLTQALAELAIPVEACPDIFAAVEKLTTRNYQIIIADWTPSVEAGFFLKAARELVFSQATSLVRRLCGTARLEAPWAAACRSGSRRRSSRNHAWRMEDGLSHRDWNDAAYLQFNSQGRRGETRSRSPSVCNYPGCGNPT